MVPRNSESSSSVPGHTDTPALHQGNERPTSVQAIRLLTAAVAAAVLAGVAALVAGEKILDAYHHDLFPPININPTVEDMSRLKAARLSTATLTFTCLGGFLGLAMGFAGGHARGSVRAGIKAAIFGVVLGAAAECLLAYVVVSVFFKRYDQFTGDLTLPLVTHGLIWLAAGAIGGLAFAIGLGIPGRGTQILLGGLFGAAVATLVYEIGGALVFASSKTELPLSASVTTRALALLLVAIFSAVGAAWAANSAARVERPVSGPS